MSTLRQDPKTHPPCTDRIDYRHAHREQLHQTRFVSSLLAATGHVMRPPIVVTEGLDAQAFGSVADVERYLEAIDVDAGIYRGWDADGLVLSFSADPPADSPTTRPVFVKVLVPERFDPEGLMALLSEVLESAGQPVKQPFSLSEIVESFVKWAGITR